MTRLADPLVLQYAVGLAANKTFEEVPDYRMPEKMKLSWLLQSVIALWILAGCSPSTEFRHRTIIYDEAWSKVAAVRNLSCVAELRVVCEREAKEGEWNLSQKLPAIFKAEPECRMVPGYGCSE